MFVTWASVYLRQWGVSSSSSEQSRESGVTSGAGPSCSWWGVTCHVSRVSRVPTCHAASVTLCPDTHRTHHCRRAAPLRRPRRAAPAAGAGAPSPSPAASPAENTRSWAAPTTRPVSDVWRCIDFSHSVRISEATITVSLRLLINRYSISFIFLWQSTHKFKTFVKRDLWLHDYMMLIVGGDKLFIKYFSE